MPRRLAIALAVVLACPPTRAPGGGLPPGDPRAEGFAPETLDKIRPVLEDAIARHQISGGSTLIARRGKVVHLATAGLRDIEANKPLERSTLFRIASMSKPITSTAVMILVDDGKIKLDDPVARFLPEFAAPSVAVAVPGPSGGPPAVALAPAERPITIHHLLTHTSGLTYRFIGNPLVGSLYVEAGVSDGLADTPGTIGDNTRRLARLPLAFQPGAKWEYSLATDVLGRVIEAASGRTFDRFLRERLFAPLKMDDTHFVVPEAKRDRLAAVYYPAEGGGIRRMPPTPVQSGPLVYSANFPSFDTGTYYSGGAGLTSTIDDYARFLQMVLNKGELDGVRILRPETVAAMTRDQIAPLDPPIWGVGDGFSYGWGVVRDGNKYKDPAGVGALSWTGFFGTYFWADVEHQVLAIYMAQAPAVPNVLVGANFKRLTYEALVGK